jgi:prepilin-type N-terminal cleavage/methylation domain-containing protein
MPMCSAAEHPREKGFSLVEVLCALAIAAMAVVMLTNGALGSLRSARQIDMHFGARIMLQSILEDELAQAGTGSESRSGEAGSYRWRLDIAPEQVDLPHAVPMGTRIYRLTASVYWERGGRVSASVLKFSR